MTDIDYEGYRAGPGARVVLHRNAARGSYAVAVVLDEGPYSAAQARKVADRMREQHAGWVSKAEAAERLGITERMVDFLRESGRLESTKDEMRRVLISRSSLDAEIERRSDE